MSDITFFFSSCAYNRSYIVFLKVYPFLHCDFRGEVINGGFGLVLDGTNVSKFMQMLLIEYVIILLIRSSHLSRQDTTFEAK